LKEGSVDEKAYDKQKRTTDDQRDERADSKEGVQRPSGKGPKHDEFTMGDVQYASNTVLEAESNSDEGVNTAGYQSADNDVQDDDKHDAGLLPPNVTITIQGGFKQAVRRDTLNEYDYSSLCTLPDSLLG
jgi:hypothetical protein